MHWLAVGPVKNWQIGIDRQVWGVPSSYEAMWRRVQEGDVLLFYATKPAKGIVGYGIVKGKERQTSPIWPEEMEIGRSLWPLRFNLDEIVTVEETRWEREAVKPPRSHVSLQRSLQRLNDEIASRLIRSVQALRQ